MGVRSAMVLLRRDGSETMRILVIEDDRETAAHIVKGLREGGHDPEHVADGHGGLARALAGTFDALIVDRMLPGLDGLAIVAAMRERGCQTPVLFLSALGDVDQRIEGLRGGGDDYLAKPFAFA